MVGAQVVPHSVKTNDIAQRCGRKGAAERQKLFSALPSPKSNLPMPDLPMVAAARQRDRLTRIRLGMIPPTNLEGWS
jgi:hypothetical protein